MYFEYNGFKEDIISVDFKASNEQLGITEYFTCALHFSPLIDEREVIIDEIVNPAIEWYKKYIAWEDRNIIDEEGSRALASDN